MNRSVWVEVSIAKMYSCDYCSIFISILAQVTLLWNQCNEQLHYENENGNNWTYHHTNSTTLSMYIKTMKVLPFKTEIYTRITLRK